MLLIIDDLRNFKDITSLRFRQRNGLKPFTLSQQEILQKYARNHDVVRSYEEFVSYLNKKDLPQMILFDHDLGEENGIIQPTGYDCLKYVCGLSLANNLGCFEAYFHSMNPVGRYNMEMYYTNFIKYSL